MKRHVLLATTILAGAFEIGSAQAATKPAAPSAEAVASVPQDTLPPNSDLVATDEQTQDIVVTGSRIRSANLNSVSPVTTLSSEELKLQGNTSPEALLQRLPSVSAVQNGGIGANGATGTATVALRNLGPYRTLVLIDGNRLMPGDPVTPAPDLKNIPSALIKRVEVVTGGASAVYGSDAVAGVINFILDRNFTGLRIDAQGGFSLHNNANAEVRGLIGPYNASTPAATPKASIADNQIDAWIKTATVVAGTGFADDRGHITVYGSWTQIDPVLAGRRDYSTCLIGSTTSTSAVLDTHACLGNANSAYGRFLNFGLADDPNGTKTFVPFAANQGYNTSPPVDLQQGETRYTAGYFANYKINKAINFYSDLLFADSRQASSAAASGLFYNNGTHAINCANPLMSVSQAAVICGPTAPNVANGFSNNLLIGYRIPQDVRTKYFGHSSFTLGVGLKGNISDRWSYDTRLQYGRTSYDQLFDGDVSNTRIDNALNVVNGPNGPRCASAAAAAQGCVPLDIFQANGAGITPAALSYIMTPAFKNGSTTEKIANINVAGDLGGLGLRSPLAGAPVAIAFGAEYRKEALRLDVSKEFSVGDLAGGGGVQPGASGAFDVKEVYSELRIPIVQDKPFFRDLSIETGYRYSKYSLAGSTSAYKASAEWAPSADIRIRGGYNRAVRAPNVIDLFSPQVITLAAFADPCSGAKGLTVTQCVNTFASPALAAAQLGHIQDCAQAQCNVLAGAPADPRSLRPEKADTFTVGFVATPRFVRGLSISVDWYKIRVNDPIVPGIGAALIVSQCLNNKLYCDLIHRDPTTGALFGGTTAGGYVINTNQNSGYLKTSGIDVSGDYRFDLSGVGIEKAGALSLSFSGTYTSTFSRQPAQGAASYDCAGLYGLVCGQPMPKWRSQTRLTWEMPWHATVSVNWRHSSSVGLDLNSSDPSLATRGVGFKDTIDGRLKRYDYFDLAGTITVRSKIHLRAGINNLFDRDPPIVDGGGNLGLAGSLTLGNGNTFPGVYDVLGRTVFFGFTADF